MASEASLETLVCCPAEQPTPADETCTKVGGEPAWGGFEAPQCPPCSECEGELAFICQVFAPVTDDQLRTLYLFTCTANTCLSLASWHVVRCQRPSDAGGAAVDAGDAAASSAGAVPSAASVPAAQAFAPPGGPELAWGFASTPGWEVSPAPSAPATAAAAAAPSLDDLDALLNARDDSATATKKKKKKKATGKKRKDKVAPPADGVVLEAYTEPPALRADDAHVRRLIERYNAEQRELGEEVVDLDAAEAGDSEDEDNAEGGVEDPDETGDAQADVFQRRIERAPTQCVRYAYGSSPLWPSSALLRSSRNLLASVPPCEGCGAERVFEMQLVPALLWQLRLLRKRTAGTAATPAAAPAAAPAATQSGEAQTGAVAQEEPPAGEAAPSAGGEQGEDDAEMDWSSVLVFSCPDSCSISSREVALALPPIR